MSKMEAVGFLERLESDEPFADELEALKGDPHAVFEKVKAAGFDTQPEEIREAFVERYGAELTPEQLDRIAGGANQDDIAIIGIAGGTALGIAFVAAAAAS